MMTFQETLEHYKNIINKDLDEFLNREIDKVSNLNPFLKALYTYIKEYVMMGGKRLRPIALIMAYKGVSGKEQESIIKASLSVELLHNSTLIHDDIIDEDDYRRNNPGIHKICRDYYLNVKPEYEYNGALFSRYSSRFAVTCALLAGNILHTIGIKSLMNNNFNSKFKNEAVTVFSRAYKIVNDGQVLDTLLEIKDNVSEDDYLRMIEKKTVNLFKASVNIGCILGNASKKQTEAFLKYAANAAIAFQLQDDIMDINPEANKGNTFGSDIKKGKKTLLIIKAYQFANNSQKEIMNNVLGNEYASKKDILELFEIIENTGSLSYCQKLAQKRINEAKDNLKGLDLTKEVEFCFIGFADYVLQRKI